MAIDFDALMKQIEADQKKANEANLARYQNLLSSLKGLSERVVGAGGTFAQAEQLLVGIGTAARQQIGEAAVKAGAMSEQDLVSRGLGSTTIREAAKRGVESDKQKALRAQEEQEARQQAGLLTQRAGFETQLGGMMAGAIEGRQDVGPNLAMFTALLQAASAAPAEGKQTLQIGRGLPQTPMRYSSAGMAARGRGGAGGAGGGGGLGAGGGGGIQQRAGGGYGRTTYNLGSPTTGPTAGSRVQPAGPGAGVYLGPGGAAFGGEGTQMFGPIAGTEPGSGFVKWAGGQVDEIGGATAPTLQEAAAATGPQAGGVGEQQQAGGWIKGQVQPDGSYIETRKVPGGYYARKMKQDGTVLLPPRLIKTG